MATQYLQYLEQPDLFNKRIFTILRNADQVLPPRRANALPISPGDSYKYLIDYVNYHLEQAKRNTENFHEDYANKHTQFIDELQTLIDDIKNFNKICPNIEVLYNIDLAGWE